MTDQAVQNYLSYLEKARGGWNEAVKSRDHGRFAEGEVPSGTPIRGHHITGAEWLIFA